MIYYYLSLLVSLLPLCCDGDICTKHYKIPTDARRFYVIDVLSLSYSIPSLKQTTRIPNHWLGDICKDHQRFTIINAFKWASAR